MVNQGCFWWGRIQKPGGRIWNSSFDSTISISKIMLPLKISDFLLYMSKFGPVLVTKVKNLLVVIIGFIYLWRSILSIETSMIYVPNCFWPYWRPIEEALSQNCNFNWQASDECSKSMVWNSNLKCLVTKLRRKSSKDNICCESTIII